MALPESIAASILRFHRSSAFATRGGVVTDLDGTAVHEMDGRIAVAEAVALGLKALADLGRPVVLNTLRFPLNVIRTFGRAWNAITSDPVPLVSLKGSVVGVLRPTADGDPAFEEVVTFPLSSETLADTVAGLETMLADGVNDIVLFHYAVDWRLGEVVWTPHPHRVQALREKYVSASNVIAVPLAELAAQLQAEGACMLSLLIDIPEDRRMAYQHTSPNRFLTATGVDKLSGAREAASRFGFDLDQSVGAGDTQMDRFLAGVGLAMQVGGLPLADRGRMETVRLRDPAELGSALLALAQLQRQAIHGGG